MNWVVFSVLMGLFVLNMIGLGMYHYDFHKLAKVDSRLSWKSSSFAVWTVFLIIAGVCYLVVLGIERLKVKLGNKENKL